MPSAEIHILLDHINRVTRTNQDGTSDGQLLEHFLRHRDQGSFETILRRHGPMVLGVCRRLLSHEADVEDAFQATFLVMIRKARSIVPREKVGNWLYGVACKTARRVRDANVRRQQRERQMDNMPQREAPAPQPSDWAEVLDLELEKLPQKYRLPIVLCDLESRPRSEVARQLTIPEGTLSSRLARGRQLLARRLARRGLALSAAALPAWLAGQSAAATIPASLATTTLRAARQLAVGGEIAALVREEVSTLMKETVKIMTVEKLQRLLLVTVGVLLGSVGLGVVLQTVGASDREPAALAAPPVHANEQPQEKRKDQPQAAPRGEELDLLPRGAIARFGSPRLQHGRPITALRFSSDGKRLFSSSEDFTARVWDVATGKELHVLMTGTSKINDIALIHNGEQIAAVTHDRGIMVFDVESGKQVKRLGPQRVRTVAVAADGQTLLAGGVQGIHVWHLGNDQEGRRLKSLQGHSTQLVVSADGKWLASIRAGDRLLQVIDWKNDKVQWSGSMRGPVTDVAFAGAGRLIASVRVGDASQLWQVKVNDPTSMPENLNLRPLTRDQQITHLALAPDGKTIYTIATNQELRALDLDSGKLRFRVKASHVNVQSLAVSPDGKALATGGGQHEHAIHLWDAETGKEQALGLTRNRADLFGLDVSRDGKVVVAGNSTQRMIIWDGATGRTLHEIDRPGADSQLRVAVSPNGKLAASSGQNFVSLWEVHTGKLLAKLPAGERIHPVRFSPDGKYLIAGGCQGHLHVWDVASRKRIRKVRVHSAEIWSLDVSPDGTMVATASFDSSAAVLQLSTGQEIARRKDHRFFVRTIVFSPDGLRVATAGEGENAIFVWEVATGQLVQQLRPEWPAISLAWCSRGRVLVSSHYYDRLHFWDVATGKWLAMSRDRPGPVYRKILASPDGRQVWTAGSDSVVRTWDVAQLVGKLPPLSKAEPTAEALEAAWNVLGRRDPAQANRAVWQLVAAGDRAVQLLTEKLKQPKQARIDEAVLRRLLRELDDSRFEVREAASAQLRKLDPVVLPILNKELRETRSLEVRVRLERIIRQLNPTSTVVLMSAAELQVARALQVLIYLNTPASRKLLETIARGKPGQFSARQAKAALQRQGE